MASALRLYRNRAVGFIDWFVSSQFVLVMHDVEVERVFLAVGGSKTHNVEQALIVLHRFHTDGTPLSEILGYMHGWPGWRNRRTDGLR